MSKYHNKKTVVNGIEFDSRKEAKRYGELLWLERAGTIKHLRRQVRYTLIPAHYETIKDFKTGKPKRVCVERDCCYTADFVYQKDGETVVEDTKGMRTSTYIIKRKLMLHVHGIKIHEV